MDAQNNRATFQLPSDGSSEQDSQEAKAASDISKAAASSSRRRTGLDVPIEERSRSRTPSPMARHKPPILRKPSNDPPKDANLKEEGDKSTADEGRSSVDRSSEDYDPEAIRSAAGKEYSQQSAQKRAERLSRTVGTQSAPVSRHTSPVRDMKRSSKPKARVRYVNLS